MPGSARVEAERLVATVLAMAAESSSNNSSGTRGDVANGLAALAGTLTHAVNRIAGSGQPGPRPSDGWSTGSAECCVCPVCRAIAAVRDPSPATAARLASSAGDLAIGVAGLMRGLSAIAGDRGRQPRRTAPPPPPPTPDEAWSAATRTTAAPANRPSGPAEHANREAGGGAGAAVATGSGAGADAGADAAAAAAAGLDPWAAASAVSAAAAEADRVAARARREAAQAARLAAAEAARRVAEAAALADAAKAAAADKPDSSAASTGADGDAARRGNEMRDTRGGGVGSGRTSPKLDVWAAATADAGVAGVPSPTTVDHDVSGAGAPGERDGAAGDDAPGDGAG
jgi:hypothetical protein